MCVWHCAVAWAAMMACLRYNIIPLHAAGLMMLMPIT